MIEGFSKVHLQWATEAEQSSESQRTTSRQAAEVYRDDAIRIVSDRAIPKAKASALAREIEAAYQWDEKQLHFSDTTALDRPLTVAVLSQGAFQNFTGDTTGSIAGVTTGPDFFIVPERVLGHLSAQDKDTLAHELTHVQDFRETGKKIDQIPTYLLEGRAYVDGNRYAQDAQVIQRVLGQLRGQDVATVLANFRHARDEQRPPAFVFIAEITGALMVEYLRTKLDGKGLPDAMKRLSKVIEDVGDGKSFPEAVHKQFGRSLEGLEKSFIAWVKNTEGNPKKRLDGTLYEPSKTPPSKPKPKAPKPKSGNVSQHHQQNAESAHLHV